MGASALGVTVRRGTARSEEITSSAKSSNPGRLFITLLVSGRVIVGADLGRGCCGDGERLGRSEHGGKRKVADAQVRAVSDSTGVVDDDELEVDDEVDMAIKFRAIALE